MVAGGGDGSWEMHAQGLSLVSFVNYVSTIPF